MTHTTLFAVLTATASFFIGSYNCAQADEPPTPQPNGAACSGWSVENDTIENAAITKQRLKDIRRITLQQYTMFHRRLVSTLGAELPEGVIFQNHGPLRDEFYPRSGVVPVFAESDLRQDTSPLSWSVQGTLGIFGFWISTARTNTTTAVCDIDGTKIYVNVDFVSDAQSIDKKLDALGGRSVRETLKLLETAGPSPTEKPKAKPKPKAEPNSDDPKRDP